MKSNRWYFVLGAVAVTALAIVVGVVISLIPTASAVTVEPVVSTTPAQGSNAARSITVVGTGSVSIAPDRATATIGVDTQAASPDEATGQNEIGTAVIEALQAAGIEPTDIQTATTTCMPSRASTQKRADRRVHLSRQRQPGGDGARSAAPGCGVGGSGQGRGE
jgi:uncharacterized protein YggE